MKKSHIEFISASAIIAALYTTLCFIFPIISFGPIQLRLSEALSLLPAIYPPAIIGITVGCLISNLIGFFTMLNPLGLIDCIFGTLASFIAAVLTYYIGKKTKGKLRNILSAIPPVFVNALLIGLEISLVTSAGSNSYSFVLAFIYIAVSQVIVCFIGGSVVLKGAEKFLKKIK